MAAPGGPRSRSGPAKVDVHDGRQLEPAAGGRRLGFLQVRDVRLGRLPRESERERTAAELAAGRR